MLSGLRVVQQYERGVIFVLGRLTGAKGPGLFWIVPFISRMEKVDLRVVTLTVEPQEVITHDNITIRVTAVIYFYVVDPIAAVINVMNFLQATTQIGQTTLRNVLGQSDLDEILAQRQKINQTLQTMIDEHTERWGVKVTVVATRISNCQRRCNVLWPNRQRQNGKSVPKSFMLRANYRRQRSWHKRQR